MSEKVHYTNKPEVLSVEKGPAADGRNFYTVATNAVEVESGWEADVNAFWEYPSVVDEEDIKSNPSKYLTYIPSWKFASMEKEYTDAIQKWMDDTVHTRGYDNVHTAASYENSSVSKFRVEGQACRQWRDEVWVAAYAYLDKVIAGEEEIIPVDELIKRLPQLKWPDEQ